MKHFKRFAFIAFICLSALSKAQGLKNELGVEGGPGLTFLYGNSFANRNIKPFFGGTVGGYYQRNLLKIFSLKTGLYYINIGSQSPNQTFSSPGQPFRTNVNTDYLSVPVLAKLSFGGIAKFFINAGPYASVLLNATQNYQNVYQSNSSDNIKYKKYDLGVAFGLGLSIDLKRISINLEERSNLGLINTNSVVNAQNGDVKTFISSLILGVGYRFGKK